MSHINISAKEITVKIVYYGPGVGGKTTNLDYIYSKMDPRTRGRLISLDTTAERTLFFDMLPLSGGRMIRGMALRMHLYTVPGQVYYNASRRQVLEGVDGIVFVADSSPARLEANEESMQNMYDNLSELNIDPDTIPIVLQYNKRDVPGALPERALQRVLNPEDLPAYLAVAKEGLGVMETLQEIGRRVQDKIDKG